MTDLFEPGFDIHGALPPVSPVILSVPHAGRAYPEALRKALGVPLRNILLLEDRCVDVVALTARRAETAIVASAPRAWIDLNRSETERDPEIDDGAEAGDASAPPSLKLRSGLGLVPRRAGGHPVIWRRRFTDAEIQARIEHQHRPYHAQLAAALEAARDRFGAAVLLDIHSMPPLGSQPHTPRIVLGDRFGKSASPRLVSRADAVASAAGFRTALNSPYSGGFALDRHGRPSERIHAIQIEIDRSCYLDRAMHAPGPGLERVATMVRTLIDALADECAPAALAAE